MNVTELKLNDKAFDDIMLKHSLALKMLETELKIMIQNYEYTNNCILCDKSHIKRPETEGTTNCVTQCTNPYYYTHYGQYKCSNTSYCPKEFNLYIKELNKCTDD